MCTQQILMYMLHIFISINKNIKLCTDIYSCTNYYSSLTTFQLIF